MVVEIGNLRSFYQFVREERLFCAILAGLLMQRGPNLGRFLTLLNERLPEGSKLSTDGLDEAHLYLEFTFLRDSWDTLGMNNDRKRERILQLLSRVPELSRYKNESFPSTIPEFNAFFMGDRGKAIKDDIVYPGQWSVAAIDRQFGQQPEESKEFQALCCFKWTFNIKPDLVILIPCSRPLCIEAKLESRDGWYPASDKEAEVFDRRFGLQQGRVRQLELQGFMFDKLLNSPCQQVVIGRDKGENQAVSFLTWVEVFQRLDKTSSLPSVHKLVNDNTHLRSPRHR